MQKVRKEIDRYGATVETELGVSDSNEGYILNRFLIILGG